MYQSHKYCPIVANQSECTEYQRYWLMLNAAMDIGYDEAVQTKLEGIAKGVGVEFRRKL